MKKVPVKGLLPLEKTKINMLRHGNEADLIRKVAASMAPAKDKTTTGGKKNAKNNKKLNVRFKDGTKVGSKQPTQQPTQSAAIIPEDQEEEEANEKKGD